MHALSQGGTYSPHRSGNSDQPRTLLHTTSSVWGDPFRFSYPWFLSFVNHFFKLMKFLQLCECFFKFVKSFWNHAHFIKIVNNFKICEHFFKYVIYFSNTWKKIKFKNIVLKFLNINWIHEQFLKSQTFF